jgi:hypothetical protein
MSGKRQLYIHCFTGKQMFSRYYIPFLLLAFSTAFGADGIAVSCHSTWTDPYAHQTGSIIRHIVRNDSTVEHTTIYADTDARCVCLSPDGTRIAFIRTSDGMLCIQGIKPGSMPVALTAIGPDALIDWTEPSRIYYTIMWDHITLRRIAIDTKKAEDIGYFPVGITQFSVSAGTSDSVRGLAVLHWGGGDYNVNTFDYKYRHRPKDSGFATWIVQTGPGCGGFISPSGALYAFYACDNDTANYHRTLSLRTWAGVDSGTVSSPSGEYFSRGCFSVNSDDWIVCTAGKDRELLKQHDMALYKRSMSSFVRITNNPAGQYDEGCDFWAGNPDSAIANGVQQPRVAVAPRASDIILDAQGNRVVLTITATGHYQANLFNLSGMQCAASTGTGPSSAAISLCGRAPGLYVVRLATSNGQLSKRILLR